MHLRGLEATLVNRSELIPIELARVESTRLFPEVFTSRDIQIQFSGLRPKGSLNPGIQGYAELQRNSFKAEANIEGLDLTEITWINPENLEGSTGIIQGSLKADKNDLEKFPRFSMVITAQNGGHVQSRFFQILLPYLPELPTKTRMQELSKKDAVIPFKTAALRMELASANLMKVFLHITVPEYNVELNINVELRIEETSSLADLVQILGFLKGPA